MITCAKCGKDNQDHYKFCLGCGAELTKDSTAPKPFSPQTPPHGVQAQTGAPATQPTGGPAAPAPSAAAPSAAAVPSPAAVAAAQSAPVAQNPGAPAPSAAGAIVECPQCGHANPTGNRFCASCGYNLGAMAAAAASAPGGAASGAGVAAPAGVAAASSNVQLTALRADGTEAGSWPLPNEPKTIVGRDTGSVFAGDSYLSPRHASLARHGATLTVRDEGSLNGVYLKLRPQAPWPLDFGDVFRIGQEIIRVEALEGQPMSNDGVERLGSPSDGYVARLALVIGRDTTGNAFPVPSTGVHLGRERGDILFSEDGYVSGLHCQVAPAEDGKLYLTDVGSSNGTFVRLGSEHSVGNGDILLMGQQLFRVDIAS